MAASAASALFLGKALANLVFVGFVELVLAPVFIVFFLTCIRWARRSCCCWYCHWARGAIVVNGTFFAALGLNAKNRQLMLPVVLFPISIPALLGVVQADDGDYYRGFRTADLDTDVVWV